MPTHLLFQKSVAADSFPFAASISDNVLRLPTAREPTVRAAEGCPPPFIETDFTARGGQRPQAAPRQKRVMRR
jgi:hypothetical protein